MSQTAASPKQHIAQTQTQSGPWKVFIICSVIIVVSSLLIVLLMPKNDNLLVSNRAPETPESVTPTISTDNVAQYTAPPVVFMKPDITYTYQAGQTIEITLRSVGSQSVQLIAPDFDQSLPNDGSDTYTFEYTIPANTAKEITFLAYAIGVNSDPLIPKVETNSITIELEQ